MTERITKLMKNFDEVSTILTRVLTAERLCVYCKARQPSTKETTTQTGITGEHEQLSWTACYDNQCRIHRSEKKSAGWLPWGKTAPRGGSLKRKGRASYREARDPSPTRQQGRSTSPENDYYPEDNHHFYMGNQPKGSHKLITLDVNVQRHKAKAVIDSGCTGNIISPKFADKIGVQRLKRAQKVYFYTFDGSPVKENNGMIEEKTGKINLKIGRHEERIKFDIVTTQGYDITLGLP